MKQGIKVLIFIAIILTCVVIFIFIDQNNASNEAGKDQINRMSLIGNIQFKGKVIKSKVYDYGGKSYYMICVKLDYTNTNNFYVLNDLCGIKIKNGIATMAAGVLDSYYGIANYVEVNINNNRKVICHFKNGDKGEFMFTLDPEGLSQNDMNTCN